MFHNKSKLVVQQWTNAQKDKGVIWVFLGQKKGSKVKWCFSVKKRYIFQNKAAFEKIVDPKTSRKYLENFQILSQALGSCQKNEREYFITD